MNLPPGTNAERGGDLTFPEVGWEPGTADRTKNGQSCLLFLIQLYSNTNNRLHAPEGAIAGLDDKLDPFTAERLRQIDRQLPQLIRRHTLIHNVVLAEYSSILVLVVCMIVIAVSAATHSGPAATAALILFLIATVTMLLGVVLFALEIHASNDAVCYEAQRVLMLGQ